MQLTGFSIAIVEDEELALLTLRDKLVTLFPEAVITGLFSNPHEALQSLSLEQPDLLFTDINMPGMTGLELVTSLSHLSSLVIFTTAYSDFALEALRLDAVDYLIKPIDSDELTEAVVKCLQILVEKRANERNARLVEVLTDTAHKAKKIVVPTDKGLLFLQQDEVIHLEGTGGYTTIHLKNGTSIVSSYNLGKFEETLSHSFFKCHKSHIIQLNAVTAFENEGYVVMGTQKVHVSRSKKQALIDLLRNNS